MDVEERFYRNIFKHGSGCWLWTGKLNRGGYGIIGVNGRNVMAHRYSYERIHGAIKPKLEIDHLCRVKHCVNPSHLEAVTTQVNLQRARPYRTKTYQKDRRACLRGHLYTPENTKLFAPTVKTCRTCYER